jgi:hypothetical protein
VPSPQLQCQLQKERSVITNNVLQKSTGENHTKAEKQTSKQMTCKVTKYNIKKYNNNNNNNNNNREQTYHESIDSNNNKIIIVLHSMYN